MSEITPQLQLEVQNFLFREARLLEEARFREWLDLLSDDIHYAMPVRRTVQPQPAAEHSDPQEVFSLFNDDKSTLIARVQRLETGIAHAEVPPSVTKRLITNVLIEPDNNNNTSSLVVHSRFMVYQVRRQHSYTFYGSRRDRVRREGPALKLAERHIELADTVLPTTISIFF